MLLLMGLQMNQHCQHCRGLDDIFALSDGMDPVPSSSASLEVLGR